MTLGAIVGRNDIQKPWYTKSIMPTEIKSALTTISTKTSSIDPYQKTSKEESRTERKERKKERKRELKHQMKQLKRQIEVEKSKLKSG